MRKKSTKILAFLLAIIMIFPLISTAGINVFADSQPSSWAVEEVNLAKEAGLTTSKITKNYTALITREEFCELAVKLYEKLTNFTASSQGNVFTDTNNPEVVKAYNLGIVNGTSATQFSPNKNITRQEICVMLVRTVDKAISGANINDYAETIFSDNNKIADWAKAAVNYAYENKIMQGIGENTIAPLNNTTCEQAILLVYRIYKNKNLLIEQDYNNIVFADNIVDIFETSPTVLTYSNDAKSVTVSNDVFKNTPKRGDIILLPPDLHYPGGRAVKLISADISGNNIILQTEEPKFEEVFENCDFNTTFEPDVDKIVELYNARQEAGIRDLEFAYLPYVREPFRNKQLIMLNDYPSRAVLANSAPSYRNTFKMTKKTDGSIELAITKFLYGNSNSDGSVTINGTFNLKFGNIHAECKSATSWTNWASVDVNVPVTVTSEITIEGELKHDFKIPLDSIPIPTTIPGLSGDITLYLTIGVKGTIEVGITHTAQMSFGAKGSLPFEKLHPFLDVIDFPFPEFKLELKASGKVVIQLKTSIKILGFDIIALTPEYGAGITAKMEPLICKNVDITLHKLFTLKFESGPLEEEIKFFDENNSELFDFYFDVDNSTFNKGKCPHTPNSSKSPTTSTEDERRIALPHEKGINLPLNFKIVVSEGVQFDDFKFVYCDEIIERDGVRLHSSTGSSGDKVQYGHIDYTIKLGNNLLISTGIGKSIDILDYEYSTPKLYTESGRYKSEIKEGLYSSYEECFIKSNMKSKNGKVWNVLSTFGILIEKRFFCIACYDETGKRVGYTIVELLPTDNDMKIIMENCTRNIDNNISSGGSGGFGDGGHSGGGF